MAISAYPRLLMTGFTSAVLLLFPSLVLLVSHGGSSPYHLLALVGLVAALLRRPMMQRPLAPEEKLVLAGFLLFTATILISLVASGFSRDAIRELDVLLRPLWGVLILLLFLRVRPPEGLLWFGLALGALVAGGNAVWEVLITASKDRADGATSAITYGNTALLMGFMAMFGLPYLRRLSGRLVPVPFLALSLGVVASLLSGSRGGWIAAPVLVGLLIYAYWRPRSRRFVIAGLLSVAALVTALVLLPQSGVQSRASRAIAEVDAYFDDPVAHGGTSVGQRFEMWRAAWDMFRQQPLLGGGIGRSYNRFLQEGVAAGRYHPEIENQTRAHNTILVALSTRGMVGLVGLLALWGTLAYASLGAARSREPQLRSLGMAAMALVVGYAMFGMTDSVMDYGPPLVFFCLYAALLPHLIAQARLRRAVEPRVCDDHELGGCDLALRSRRSATAR